MFLRFWLGSESVDLDKYWKENRVKKNKFVATSSFSFSRLSHCLDLNVFIHPFPFSSFNPSYWSLFFSCFFLFCSYFFPPSISFFFIFLLLFISFSILLLLVFPGNFNGFSSRLLISFLYFSLFLHPFIFYYFIPSFSPFSFHHSFFHFFLILTP